MGKFVNEPLLHYEDGEVHAMYGQDNDRWSGFEAKGFLDNFNYDQPCAKLWWKPKECLFEGNLRPFETNVDAMELVNYAISNKCEVGIFVQHKVSTVEAKNAGHDYKLGENMVDVETKGAGDKDRGGQYDGDVHSQGDGAGQGKGVGAGDKDRGGQCDGDVHGQGERIGGLGHRTGQDEEDRCQTEELNIELEDENGVFKAKNVVFKRKVMCKEFQFNVASQPTNIAAGMESVVGMQLVPKKRERPRKNINNMSAPSPENNVGLENMIEENMVALAQVNFPYQNVFVAAPGENIAPTKVVVEGGHLCR
ncbi:hypothetical protein VNO78_23212 [Psophocarpus tetragonolobus]|uniref:PB1-like domain-containing protein n=1 Tax=Psophocarpus tetragonolobus TaxID=3891 RepID=A0AAN9XDT5_PSOTE